MIVLMTSLVIACLAIPLIAACFVGWAYGRVLIENTRRWLSAGRHARDLLARVKADSRIQRRLLSRDK